jgi:Flp pilus assembly protein TadD
VVGSRFAAPLLAAALALDALAQTGVVAVPPTPAEEINRLMRAGDLAGALARAEALLQKEPRNLQVRFLRGVILSDQGRTEQAVAAFEALTQDFPELPEPYNNLAVLHAGQGRLEQARALLQRAIDAQPNYVTAHENLGDLYIALAAESYQRALKLDPNNRAVQSKLALARDIGAKLRATR